MAKGTSPTIWCHTQHIKLGEGWQQAAAQGLAGHQLFGGEQLILFASFVFLGIYFPFYYNLLPLLLFNSEIVPISTHKTFTLPILFPYPTGSQEEGERVALLCLAANWA